MDHLGSMSRFGGERVQLILERIQLIRERVYLSLQYLHLCSLTANEIKEGRKPLSLRSHADLLYPERCLLYTSDAANE